MAPVFLGAEDHPPRDRRPKCLTGSAITLVRSAQSFQIGANPRGRHARVADPSGVECQRDGSDQGQRMEAGDGALTPDRSPAPSQVAHRSPALPPRWSQRIVLFEAGTRPASTAGPEYEAGLRARPDHWHQAATRQPRATRLLPARPAVAQGIVARMGGDCPAGSRRDDQSPVPALPGCAKSFF